ncbi:hypothetical protein D3C76_1545120 [compost metagenome]
MHDPANLRRLFLLQNLQYILMGVTVMDDNGLAQLFGQPDLLPEHPGLHILGRRVPIIIQSDFA